MSIHGKEQMQLSPEKLHESIVIIQENMLCNIFEAVLIFCQENSIDIEDIIDEFDAITIQKLKQSAIEEKMVRKSSYHSHFPLPL